MRGVSFLRVFQGTDLHFNALKAYFEAALGTDAETVALMNKLVEAGNLYLQYAMKTSDEELKNSFLAAMEEATALKNALTNTENYTQYLEKLYTEYLEAYNEIKNPPATEG